VSEFTKQLRRLSVFKIYKQADKHLININNGYFNVLKPFKSVLVSNTKDNIYGYG
jgi:hypothetical protein